MLRTILFILLSCAISVAVANDQRAQTKQQIAQTAKEIAEIKKQLSKIQQEKSAAEQALRKTETEIGQLEQQIKALQQQEKETQQELHELQQQQKKFAAARQEQQKLIAIQARAAYQSGQKEPFRLLLNQQQPEQFSRNLTYYQYIGQARQKQINEFNTTLQQLTHVSEQITKQQSVLAEQRSQLAQQQESLQALRKQRQQRVAAITEQQRKESRSLQARQADQAELNKVLKTIEETLARQAREAAQAEQRRQQRLAEQQRQAEQTQMGTVPFSKTSKAVHAPIVSTAATHSGGAFKNLRGKLPWPVNGRLIAHFGSPRGDSRTKWDGVLISAPAGTQVRAIHSGRVVFADWLRGAGLLVIVDHGGGYMSLYGHNQSLLSKPGDQVQAGQAISTVGNTGGRDDSALYFAIREKGQPTDPARWSRR